VNQRNVFRISIHSAPCFLKTQAVDVKVQRGIEVSGDDSSVLQMRGQTPLAQRFSFALHVQGFRHVLNKFEEHEILPGQLT